MNALRSGIDAKSQIIRGEDPRELEDLKASYYEDLKPAGPREAVFVDAIIAADWLLRRLRKTEAQLWNRSFEEQDNVDDRLNRSPEENPLARAFTNQDSAFHRLQRRLDSTERSLHRAVEALRRLRQAPPNPDSSSADPPSSSVTPSIETIKPQIGFVPPNHPIGVAAPLKKTAETAESLHGAANADRHTVLDHHRSGSTRHIR